MKRTKTRALTVALSGVLVAGLAACSGGGTSTGSNTTGGSGNSGSSGSTQAAGKKGGTLYYYTSRNAEHYDPQRTYIGRDIANESRMVYRTLTTFPSADGDASLKLVPDLATDTGKASNGNKTWTFTIKKGQKWQDGKDITCQDFQYGISRTFATDVITGGPNYAIQFLDIPQNADGSSKYPGPYKAKPAQQKMFDKAVACSGNTITFHLNRPVPDFNQAVYLPAFAPYRKDQDHGDKSNFDVFSDGPYKLQGKWNEGGTNTFVRNPEWKPDGIRKALPDKIVITEGMEDEVIAQKLIADQGNDKFAVTDRSVPAPFIPKVISNPNAKDRATNPNSPFNSYLLPNFKSKVMQNKAVREALLVATDKKAASTALGTAVSNPNSLSIVNPALKGNWNSNPYNTTVSGDPAKAKKILQKAGVKMPVPITYIYSRGSNQTDKQAAALQEGWQKAGFKVSLDPQTQNYYTIIQDPSKASQWDVCWGGWGADWPSASTVIPPLFDSRVNLNKSSNGQDYGAYANPQVNKAIDASYNTSSPEEQAKALEKVDDMLKKDVAYVPLDITKFFLIRGSGITGWVDNKAFADYPDLGAIGVSGS
ncbi:MAG TPA: ABC transporter substrate-binding protein [Segeticoccus sp.]|uniref:ABC transporter substrate-binding protein n=1 Tax=Segeticoccus sp. TaxID=2706531 RepID=UPI002D7F392E|nr:ABC transporter substrate-binding protein [Segeticoccus sp.]HET8599866.1 ABC transporter substrate-binding protein [Segeticoccus sp.]